MRATGYAAGKAMARKIKAKAAETVPDDYAGQQSFILGYLSSILATNAQPTGRPWPAEYLRGLGSELSK